ncbi:MAG: chorismate mutase [Sphaerochaetaceae bacterium]
MEERIVAIRGAIQVVEDSPAAIEEGVERLYHAICMANTLIEEQMISLIFSITNDLKSFNPATALRRSYPAFGVPLFCTQEASIEGMLPRTIRILIHCYSTQAEVHHIYLEGARSLRSDLNNNYS